MTIAGGKGSLSLSPAHAPMPRRCRMSEHLTLNPDELLTTTRAVRKRLDFTRPVPRAVLEECLTIAQ